MCAPHGRHRAAELLKIGLQLNLNNEHWSDGVDGGVVRSVA